VDVLENGMLPQEWDSCLDSLGLGPADFALHVIGCIQLQRRVFECSNCELRWMTWRAVFYQTLASGRWRASRLLTQRGGSH